MTVYSTQSKMKRVREIGVFETVYGIESDMKSGMETWVWKCDKKEIGIEMDKISYKFTRI